MDWRNGLPIYSPEVEQDIVGRVMQPLPWCVEHPGSGYMHGTVHISAAEHPQLLTQRNLEAVAVGVQGRDVI